MKKAIILIVCISLALTLAGCGGGTPQIPRPSASADDDGNVNMFEVTGSCEAELNGDTLTIKGTSNLMDGTNGIISVLNSNGTTAEEHKFTKSGDEISYDFQVQDDWDDVVYGFIYFDTENADKQPAEVTNTYGKKFENLTGEEDVVIWNLKGVIAIFHSGEIDLA